MKENILYAYHIQVDQIKEYKEYSVFEWNQKTYYFTKVRRNQEEYQDLLEVIRELEQKKIPILPFIVNVYGSYLTEINNEAYVLIEVDNPLHEYNLVDMLERNKSVVLNSKRNNLYRNEWGRLWSQKVDYLEYQVSEMGKKYPIIVNSFSYFVGLAENAISYANHVTRTIKIPNSPIVLSHRRVGFPNYRLNYDNPLNDVESNIELIKIPVENSYLIAAHSGTGKKAYFNDLRLLDIGDDIYLDILREEKHYQVTNIYRTIKDGDISISNKSNMIYLTTCDQIFEGYQLVIEGTLV